MIEGPPRTDEVPFNANSNPQVVKAMVSLGWEANKINESGSINVGEAVLWNSGHRTGKLFASYRAYSKLRSMATSWLKHQRDGRLYPRFTGLRAATGRSASRVPNIQQVPTTKRRASGMRIMDSYGKRCRELFCPRTGHVLIGADLKGIEVRLLAHRLHQFDNGEFADLVLHGDVHQRNADKIGITRDQAKTTLYGSMYGQGAKGLAEKLHRPIKEAHAIINALTTGITGFAEMKAGLAKELRESGRIRLIDGRKLQVSSNHKCLNYALQGEAAILMKHWVLASANKLDGTSYRILAVVHDEIQGECLPEHIDIAKATVEETATLVGDRLGFKVRIDADARHGASWHDTH